MISIRHHIIGTHVPFFCRKDESQWMAMGIAPGIIVVNVVYRIEPRHAGIGQHLFQCFVLITFHPSCLSMATAATTTTENNKQWQP